MHPLKGNRGSHKQIFQFSFTEMPKSEEMQNEQCTSLRKIFNQQFFKRQLKNFFNLSTFQPMAKKQSRNLSPKNDVDLEQQTKDNLFPDVQGGPETQIWAQI